MRTIAALGIAALLGGCATASETYAPDGRKAYSLNCSGLARTWGHCLEKAGDLCGDKGYDILSGNSDRGTFASGSASQTFASFSGGSTISRSMLVACKRP
ncbi:hypothetical protein K7G19_07395 [Cupriavidus sp. DB3]|uniref:hypothetical protein n=1 Tax=Cupriavidus sp. DB3 TaxID=2873259 RepID=UPI001CF101A6|nr:hypothetical protein [Cupriavidus sp. DB3]MCA7083423.1 hypothetical protein [Cupriavidus sp. DB3]